MINFIINIKKNKVSFKKIKSIVLMKVIYKSSYIEDFGKNFYKSSVYWINGMFNIKIVYIEN